MGPAIRGKESDMHEFRVDMWIFCFIINISKYLYISDLHVLVVEKSRRMRFMIVGLCLWSPFFSSSVLELCFVLLPLSVSVSNGICNRKTLIMKLESLMNWMLKTWDQLWSHTMLPLIMHWVLCFHLVGDPNPSRSLQCWENYSYQEY